MRSTETADKTGAGRSRGARARSALAVASVLLAAIAWIDYATGFELEFFVFYFVPVAIGAWYVGRRSALLLAVAAASCWYASDRLSGHGYSSAYLVYWQTGVRFASFLIIALALSAVQTARRRQEAVLHAVSHDLREPLAVISGQAELLQRRGSDPALTASSSAAILRSARRMRRMVDDILDSARSSHGSLRLELQEVELTEWLPRALGELREALDVSRVELALPPGPVRPVRVDPARFERVLANLLSNALKYSPSEAKVRLAVDPGRDGWVTLAVIDRGEGLSREDQRQLFRPFQRGSAAVNRSGVGLGLVSAVALVKAHGGRLRVASRAGEGAAFMVDLPPSSPTSAP
jgi:signal transduction histidine kinase